MSFRNTCFWLEWKIRRNSYGKKHLKATKSYITFRNRGFSRHLEFRSRITEINSFLAISFPRLIRVFWKHGTSTSVMLGRSQAKIVKDFNTELSLSCATMSRNSFRFEMKQNRTHIKASSLERAVKFKRENTTGVQKRTVKRVEPWKKWVHDKRS